MMMIIIIRVAILHNVLPSLSLEMIYCIERDIRYSN